MSPETRTRTVIELTRVHVDGPLVDRAPAWLRRVGIFSDLDTATSWIAREVADDLDDADEATPLEAAPADDDASTSTPKPVAPRLPEYCGWMLSSLRLKGCLIGFAAGKRSYTRPVERDLALARLAALMPTLRERFGVRELAVFGSVARGEAQPASDLDLLVDFAGPTTFDAYMGVKLFLEDTLAVKVDLGTRAALKPRLRARIELEARRVA
jgi:predicted nucleotidyltransferase